MISKKNDVVLPKDLKVRLGSKLERFWTQVLNNAKGSIEDAEYTIILQKKIREIAEEEIALEQKKFDSNR